MKLALWTPRAADGWPARLVPALSERAAVVLVTGAPEQRPRAELDVYDLANAAAHAFVYDALLARPGLVVLASLDLHALVFAATAGRGAAGEYVREAARERGAAGRFVAGQVLQGAGGALAGRLLLGGRVLDASVAAVVLREEAQADAARRLAGRPLRFLPLDDPLAPADALADALVALAREGLRLLPERSRELAEERSRDGTPAGRALEALRPRARDLGLPDLPASARDRVLSLLAGRSG